MKHNIRNAAAVLLALGLVLMIVPVMNSAVSKAPRTSFVQIVKLPALLFSSMIQVPAADDATIAAPVKNPSSGKVRPTDDIQIPKPGTGN
jgi:hypothetical protein